jgi:hypothetical protein
VSVTEAVTVAPTTPAPTSAPPTAPPTTAPPATPAPPTTVATTAPPEDDVVEIVVDADTAAAAPLEESVALGQQVRLVIRTATAQEFHMHGYDLEDSGTEVVFAFTADLPGAFELESHDTGDLLLTLTVA